MGTRLELQTELETILGSRNVYFQPPENIKMLYPCIVYGPTQEYVQFADGQRYLFKWRYQVTVIDKDPDSLIPNKVALLPMCKIDRIFASNNLNHYVYNLYY